MVEKWAIYYLLKHLWLANANWIVNALLTHLLCTCSKLKFWKLSQSRRSNSRTTVSIQACLYSYECIFHTKFKYMNFKVLANFFWKKNEFQSGTCTQCPPGKGYSLANDNWILLTQQIPKPCFHIVCFSFNQWPLFHLSFVSVLTSILFTCVNCTLCTHLARFTPGAPLEWQEEVSGSSMDTQKAP